MPEDAERKGIGTPATRAANLEKLVSTGLVERKKAKKITNLLPTQTGSSLVTVLPEVLQSPLLTADWEQRLGEVERGELSPKDFMAGIAAMVDELVKTYRPVPGAAVLFPSDKESVAPCPRCGGAVTESKKGFFCENRECRFVLWKDSKFSLPRKRRSQRPLPLPCQRIGSCTEKSCRRGPSNAQEICKEQGIDLTAQQPEQDTPSAAPDTLEQFAADLFDFMEQLHQEGVLKHPFTQDPRERSIADLVDEMRKGYFEGVRGPLNYLIEHTNLIHTDLTKAKAMLERLDGLV